MKLKIIRSTLALTLCEIPAQAVEVHGTSARASVPVEMPAPGAQAADMPAMDNSKRRI